MDQGQHMQQQRIKQLVPAPFSFEMIVVMDFLHLGQVTLTGCEGKESSVCGGVLLAMSLKSYGGGGGSVVCICI
jgi:hypothetical protein